MAEGEFGYNPKLPEDIRELFQVLCQDVVSLRSHWDFYADLFGKPEHADLLSDMARGSFQIIEESLRKSMTMSFGRLADRAETFDRKDRANCSLATLVQRCGQVSGIDSTLQEFQDTVSPIKTYRDKRVAHNDLAT